MTSDGGKTAMALVSGRRPFGYATKDRSEVDDLEAEIIRGAAELDEAKAARDEIEQWHQTGAIKGDAFLRMHQPAEDLTIR